MAKSLDELKAERGTRKRAVTLAINAAKQALVELSSNDKLTEYRKKLVEAFRELETVQAAVIHHLGCSGDLLAFSQVLQRLVGDLGLVSKTLI